MEQNNTDTFLLDTNHRKAIELLPVVVVMCVLGLVGVVGNAVTIKFYKAKRRKTPTIFLIQSLAIVDLIVCILFVPNIVEMCLNVLYTSAEACKTMHFLGHWFVESSGLILGFIAFDRYWKICGHTRRKISKTVAKRAVMIILIFSCVMSVRDFVNFDIIRVNLNKGGNSSSPVGHYCTNTDDSNLQLSVFVFHLIDAITFIFIFLVIIFAYSNVLRTLYKVDAMRRKVAQPKSDKCPELKHIEREAQSSKNAPAKVADSSDPNQSQLPSSPRIQEDADTCFSMDENNITLQRVRRKQGGKKNIRKSERNVTMLMLAVSAAFFLCASPYFIARIVIRVEKRSSDLELGLLMQFCLRLGYINSVLNPLIYCLFNPSFRRHMKRFLTCSKRSDVNSEFYFPTATSDWSTVKSRDDSDDKLG